jgi:cytochrome c peroxidase
MNFELIHSSARPSKTPHRFSRGLAILTLVGLSLTRVESAGAADLDSLKNVAVPEPVNLGLYVADKNAAIRLGKALFWDVQIGSDGATACATCHFHAGTDHRTRNTLVSGPNGVFDATLASNRDVSLAAFPFHKMSDPESRGTGGVDPDDPAVVHSLDDRTGAAGVVLTRFLGIQQGQAEDSGRVLRQSADVQSQGHNVRQITGRNAPTVINAVFNFANFWDGRANHYFNGVNPFGPQDVNARIWVNNSGSFAPLDLSLPANQLNNSSLASQAVGPPLSDVEMSWLGRTFPDLGRKLLPLRPLALQEVHPQDSVFASLRHASGKGLNITYATLVRQAFQANLWNGAGEIAGYSQMETNFSLFFGLAVQLYEATLIADDTPVDRFLSGDVAALSESAQRGLNTFQSVATGCINCHVGAELTANSVGNSTNPLEPGLVETMNMGNDGLATYDIGFYNIGVTLTDDDLGRGANDPFGNPLSFSRQRAILNGHQNADTADGQLTFAPDFVPSPGCVPDLLATPALICPPDLNSLARIAVNGNFKAPHLRNIELTGPYMHNGSMVTLMQVVDFYVRGGNFREANLDDLDPFINDINALKGPAAEELRRELVDFLLALTDERVRWEQAPFDHPQLLVADGHENRLAGHPKRTRALADRMLEQPAVGRNGRQAEGLGPLKPYLADDLAGVELENFHYQP